MQTVVGVSFKKAGKIYYFDPSDIELRSEDKVIVETSRGVELGEVVINPREVEEDQIVQPLKKVIRKATPKDLEQLEINQQKEKEAYTICLEKIANHGLPMKLVDVEYTFDNNKIIFYFTADGRVDFRELVKDLASVFRTRIELRQIGVRDEAKMIGGLGPCGLELCCKTFLREFEPISIKMAKNQELSLNPAKISGICGRLMCCLRYECDTYDDEILDDDVVIDDPAKLVDEEIDEYEKYISFGKKFAKDLVEDDDETNTPDSANEEGVLNEEAKPKPFNPRPRRNDQRKNYGSKERGIEETKSGDQTLNPSQENEVNFKNKSDKFVRTEGANNNNDKADFDREKSPEGATTDVENDRQQEKKPYYKKQQGNRNFKGNRNNYNSQNNYNNQNGFHNQNNPNNQSNQNSQYTPNTDNATQPNTNNENGSTYNQNRYNNQNNYQNRNHYNGNNGNYNNQHRKPYNRDEGNKNQQ